MAWVSDLMPLSPLSNMVSCFSSKLGVGQERKLVAGTVSVPQAGSLARPRVTTQFGWGTGTYLLLRLAGRTGWLVGGLLGLLDLFDLGLLEWLEVGVVELSIGFHGLARFDSVYAELRDRAGAFPDKFVEKRHR